MALDKLRLEVQELCTKYGLVEMNKLQEKVLDGLKAGKNLLVEGEEGSGKTTALLLSILQRVDAPGEGSPRALIICANDQKAIDMHAALEKFCRPLDLTVDLANDKGNMLMQRNSIFDGTEILVGTPKRLHDLYIQNGFNVGKLKLFVLDDLFEMIRAGHKIQLARLAESLPKCQHVFSSSNFTDKKTDEFLDELGLVYAQLTID
jgi:ATP-dependent RNA helicase RhlE